MAHFGNILLLLIAFLGQDPASEDRSKIEIENYGKYIPYQIYDFDGGPVVGNMLNAHYFPGLVFYRGGRYKEAEPQFTYVILRPSYLDANPRRAEYLSTAYYMRGMIYFYHANGVGRYSLAQADFESALQWNPQSYVVYLELSRLYSTLGFYPQAASLVQRLLDLMPEETIAQEAHKELDTITQKIR